MEAATPELLVFDCDGVLIDSEIIASQAHAAALTAIGYPMTAAEMIRRFTGIPDRDMYVEIEADWGRSLPVDYDDDYQHAMKQAYATELRAIVGVHDLLQRLSLAKCVASSSTPDKLRLGLTVTGLHDHFAPHIFSATQVARAKPAPDLFLFAAAQMGADPARCLVIEDSIAGVQAAKAAGMPVVGFTGGSHCGSDHDEQLMAHGADRTFADMIALGAFLIAQQSHRGGSM